MRENISKWAGSPKIQHYIYKVNTAVREWLMGLFRLVVTLGVVYIILIPILGIISNSIKDYEDLYNPLVYLIPEHFTNIHYKFAVEYMDYFVSLFNSVSLTLASTALQVVVCSMVGYGFARFRFPGSSILFGLVIATIVVPVQTFTVPMFMQFRYFSFFGLKFNFISTYWPAIILTATGMGLRSGLYIYIFRQFFKGLPKEVEEAALIDGAGPFRTYAAVMMPNAVSAIITVAMFSFVWQYNDTFYSALLMSGKKFLPVSLGGLAGLYTFAGERLNNNQVRLIVYAGIIITIIPVLVFYLGLQRYFMEGIERSGIVG